MSAYAIDASNLTKVFPGEPGRSDGGYDSGPEVGAAPPDTGADSTPADSGFDGPCALSLDAGTMPFGGCPALFTEQAWIEAVCPLRFGMAWEQTCAGYFSRQIDLSTHGWTCYYDLATAALVAARFADDVPSFCGMTSSVVVYGSIPAPGACTTPDPATFGCPGADGGTDTM